MSAPQDVVPDHGLTPELFPAGSKIDQAAIDTAVETIRRLADWHVWPERAETLRVDSPGDPMVVLPTKRLVAVNAVRVDGKEVAVDPDGWSPDGTIWIDGLRPTCSGRPRRVEVDVVHGYSGPGDVLSLVRSMAGRSASPSQSYQVGRINVGAPGAATPQSTEWRIIDEIRLGPLP